MLSFFSGFWLIFLFMVGALDKEKGERKISRDVAHGIQIENGKSEIMYIQSSNSVKKKRE